MCYLHGDKRVVDSLFFHQFTVSPQLYNFTLLETSDDVRISDGRQAVSHDYGGATQPDLQTKTCVSVFVFKGVKIFIYTYNMFAVGLFSY